LKKNVFFLSKFGKLNLASTQLARWKDDLLAGASPAELSQPVPRLPMDITLVFGSETNGLFGLIGEEAMRGFPVVYMPMLVRNPLLEMSAGSGLQKLFLCRIPIAKQIYHHSILPLASLWSHGRPGDSSRRCFSQIPRLSRAGRL
jgi:hypothetical protein